MSDAESQDLDGLIEQLEAEEREISELRRRLHDRLASFPNDVTAKQERALSRQRAELQARIDALRATRSAKRAERQSNDDGS
jgi:hypothetical protein